MLSREVLARRSDPVSSHIANAIIANDHDLSSKIVNGALSYWYQFENHLRPSPLWTDTEMTEYIEWATGRRQQRSVIARARGLLEDIEPHRYCYAPITRIEIRQYERRPMMHFVHSDFITHGLRTQ